jgi:hypothetical protein
MKRSYTTYGVRDAGRGKYDTKRQRPVMSMIFGKGKSPSTEFVEHVLRNMPQDKPEDVFKLVEEAENQNVEIGSFGLSMVMQALRTHSSRAGGGSSATAIAILEKQLELAPENVTPFYVAMVANACLADKQYQMVQDLFAFAVKTFKIPHRLHYGYMIHVAYRTNNFPLALGMWKEAQIRRIRLKSSPLSLFLRLYRREHGEKAAARLLMTSILPSSPTAHFALVREAVRIFYEMGDVFGMLDFVTQAQAHSCRPYVSLRVCIRQWHLMAAGRVPSYDEFRDSSQLVEHLVTYEDLAREALARNRVDHLAVVIREVTRLAAPLAMDVLAASCKALLRDGSKKHQVYLDYLFGTFNLQVNSREGFEASSDLEAYREIMRQPVGRTNYVQVIEAAVAGVRPPTQSQEEPAPADTDETDDLLGSDGLLSDDLADSRNLLARLERKRPQTEIRSEVKAANPELAELPDVVAGSAAKGYFRRSTVEEEGDGENSYVAPQSINFQIRPAHCAAILERILEQGLDSALQFYDSHVPVKFRAAPVVATVLMKPLNAALRFSDAAAVAERCLQTGNVTIDLVNEIITAWAPSKGVAAAAELIVQHGLEHNAETLTSIFRACLDTKNHDYATQLSSLLKEQYLPAYAPAFGAYLQLLAQENKFDEMFSTFWLLTARPQPYKWLQYAAVRPILQSIVLPKIDDRHVAAELERILSDLATTPRASVDWRQLTSICEAVNGVAAVYGMEPQPIPIRNAPVTGSSTEDDY